MRNHWHKWKDILNFGLPPAFTKLVVGEGVDNAEIDQDGIKLNGDSTVWNDIQASLIGQQLSLPAGTADYNYNNNSVTFSPNGSIALASDRVIWNYQHPHSAKLDGYLNVHIHWEQPNATVRTWTLQYRVQDNGGLKETAWTTVNVNTGGASDLFTYTSGTLNQITKLVDIDMSPYSLSAVLQFRLTRSDSNAGDIEAIFVDAHYEIDTMGSREEYSK